MSKKQRNIFIIALVILVLLFLAPAFFFGVGGSPFRGTEIFGGNLRELFFGDTGVALSELRTDCERLSDDSFDVSDDCSIEIEGSEETIDFDSPRDLRLRMCWGSVTVNMTNAAEKITVEDARIPTQRNAEALTFNIFEEGDSSIDIACESDDCRVVFNDTECPAQTPIARRHIRPSGCVIGEDDRIFFNTACVLQVDTTDFEDEDDNRNPIFFAASERPRVVEVHHCQGEVLFNASSAEGNFPTYDPVEMPGDNRQREVDVYGADVTTISLVCVQAPPATATPATFTGTSSGVPSCMVMLSDAGCFPEETENADDG